MGDEEKEVSWGTTINFLTKWTVDIHIEVEATNEAMSNWRARTWQKLKTAYDKLVEAQQAALQAAKFNASLVPAGGPFQGRNPESNATVMREEVKKACISIMTDQHFDTFTRGVSTSMTQSNGADITEINIASAAAQGPYVRFFEQAFEWDQMTWLTYPYFWGRKNLWFQRLDYSDDSNDPVFEKFMKAGYARANVPVRPGFEGALEYYISTGRVWNGGELPGISDKMFLPLATEIQESLGKKADEPVKYGEPWTVVVPTNLIRLRKDDKTPEWKRGEDGKWAAVPDKEV
jgi:hypothetical protein